jgi:predicted transcriptional regulator
MRKRPDPESQKFIVTSVSSLGSKSHKLIPTSTNRMKASSFRLDAATLERLDRVAAAYADLSLPLSRGAILRQAVDLGLNAVEAKLQALAKAK